tara:strand:+ start:89 stop:508 length:420 start_codon:yes stop_codon:yes gene_type:complete
MSNIRLSSSHGDDDIGAQPTIKFSRDKEEFNIVRDDEFFVVKLGEQRTVFSAGDEEVANLRDISDINSTAISAGVGTSFILTYDAVEDNFKFVSPDAVVDSAAGNVSGAAGFSDQVINNLVDTLDVELDDKIDLDAGTW